MSTHALIGLGSNLGDRRAHLEGAIAALGASPGIRVGAVSSFHETAPVGGPPGQGAFLNAAAVIETTLPADQVLQVLQEVEREAGRVREVIWGARTLDLDLLLFDDAVLDTPTMRVPHPRMAIRRFVLAPLAEIAPLAIHPLTGRAVADLLRDLDRKPRCVVIWGWPPETRSMIVDGLVVSLGATRLPSAGPGARAEGIDADHDRWLVAQCHTEARAQVMETCGAGFGPGSNIARKWPSGVPQPTFIALPKRAGTWRTETNLFRPVPILEIESERPAEALAEVLAACRAAGP